MVTKEYEIIDSVETLEKMQGLVDVYLPDLKYFSSEKSQKYAKCPDYFEKASKAILEMYRQQTKNEFKDGIIQKGVAKGEIGIICAIAHNSIIFFNINEKMHLQPLSSSSHNRRG